MNPQFNHPIETTTEADLWDILDRIPGTEGRPAVELIYEWVRRCEGLIVLSQPSLRVAISAILAALRSESKLGPPRVYITDPHRGRLMLLFAELNKRALASEITLYHGSLVQFFRDLPLRADLICAGIGGLELNADGLRSSVAAGTAILSPTAASRPEDPANAQHLVELGILEEASLDAGGAVYRATNCCRGVGLVPRTQLRIALQGGLHERYFLSEASADAGHTSVADLTECLRREFSRECPAASGLGSWPYAVPDSGDLPLTLPSGKPWPKVSIVTPTRNQGRYLEETILSVLHQNYPNLEYVIVDGASTDETPSILERYRSRLSLVISEPDNGQSHAINKGMAKTTGDILTWLNSDDMLAPGALAAVALAFDVENADMIAGICRLYRDGRLESQHLTSCADGPLPLEDLLDLDRGWNAGQFFVQPEVMFTRNMWLRAGGYVDQRLFYSMDYDLWLRFAHAGACLHVIGRPVSWFRIHVDQKTHALSNVLLEQISCRDAFVKQNGITVKPALPLAPWRQKLRITLLNDHGGAYGAGIAHIRLGRSLASAGHDISMVAILASPADAAGPLKYTLESVLDRVSATRPDLVIVGNLHGARADPMILHLLAERFPTLVVLHDFWLLTGRCAYTADCEKYLSGCDQTCPTPNEYPALPPGQIEDAWRKKRQLLSAKRRPMLLANSEWTAEFARRAVAAAAFPSGRAPSVEAFRLSFPLDVFRPRDQKACREHFGLPENRFVILLPASLDEARKGARTLLDALARLELPNLLVVTIGWPSSDLPRNIEVLQLGYISDPHKVAMLNSAVDVVVAPSSAETFGQIYIEAIACGTPVVGYPLAAVPEAILDGVTGLLALDSNPASLAAAVHYLYTHPGVRKDLSKWGRLHVENEWSELSAYRHFFCALHRLGLAKSLDLRRKIDFLVSPPPLPLSQHVSEKASGWRPCQGFAAYGHFPLDVRSGGPCRDLRKLGGFL